MGHHYVPQRYLKNFQATERPGFIWLHSKQGEEPRLVSIRQAAQSRGYYSDETEDLLAHAVERPANKVMDKLIRQEAISEEERFNLTYYLGTMLKRVPYRRRKAREMYPSVLTDRVNRIRSDILALAEASPNIDQALVARRIAEVDAAQRKFSVTPPAEVEREIMTPWPSEGILDAINRMTWRVLNSSGPQYFITSDNPAFFFTAYGLANEDSELCFSLSTTHALHGCWQGASQGLLYLKAPQWFVKEANRRLASTTERMAFYHERAPWLKTILAKKNPYLSVIKW